MIGNVPGGRCQNHGAGIHERVVPKRPRWYSYVNSQTPVNCPHVITDMCLIVLIV